MSRAHTEPELDWSHRSRCAGYDPELFFPEPGEDPSAAKAVCRECPVRRQCLDWAIDTNQRFGVWGGMTEGQRRRIRRRELEAAPVPLRLAATAGSTPFAADHDTRAADPTVRVRHLTLVR